MTMNGNPGGIRFPHLYHAPSLSEGKAESLGMDGSAQVSGCGWPVITLAPSARPAPDRMAHRVVSGD